MKNISIFKSRFFLQKKDIIDALEIYENDNLKYYSYIYRIWEKKYRGTNNSIDNVDKQDEDSINNDGALKLKEPGEVQGFWRPLIRWDNYDEKPHVDVYGENQNLISQQPITDHKDLKEIVELVKIFRRNLAVMNISEI